MTSTDWADALGPLELRYGGKVYRFPLISFNGYRRLRAFNTAIQTGGDTGDMSDDDMYDLIFGAALLKQIQADDVPARVVRVMVSAGYAEHLSADPEQGRREALAIWEAKGDPEAAGRNLAASRTTSSASATTTRSRASTSRTKPATAPSKARRSASTTS